MTNTKYYRLNSLEKADLFSQIKKAEIKIPKTSVFTKNTGFIWNIIFCKKTDHDQQFTNIRNVANSLRIPKKDF